MAITPVFAAIEATLPDRPRGHNRTARGGYLITLARGAI
jgi:hypothetical protein